MKGSNVIDLIKLVKTLEKRAPLPMLSTRAHALVTERILSSAWYALAPFLELLDVVDALVLHDDERRALEMGIAGGAAALLGPARLYLQSGDPKASVLAMRHAWRARHDFGELSATVEGPSAVRFTLSAYDDIRMVHALTTAGWGIAAARAAGASHTSLDVLSRPWKSVSSFSYRINY